MAAIELLEQLRGCGVSVTVDIDELVLRPGSRIPSTLLLKVRQHKHELIQELTTTYGDGQPPPLDRPPATEQELRRLMDYIADADTFDAWLDWAMNYTDPAETLRWNP